MKKTFSFLLLIVFILINTNTLGVGAFSVDSDIPIQQEKAKTSKVEVAKVNASGTSLSSNTDKEFKKLKIDLISTKLDGFDINVYSFYMGVDTQFGKHKDLGKGIKGDELLKYRVNWYTEKEANFDKMIKAGGHKGKNEQIIEQTHMILKYGKLLYGPRLENLEKGIDDGEIDTTIYQKDKNGESLVAGKEEVNEMIEKIENTKPNDTKKEVESNRGGGTKIGDDSELIRDYWIKKHAEIDASPYLSQRYHWSFWPHENSFSDYMIVDAMSGYYDELSEGLVVGRNDAVNPETGETLYKEMVDSYNTAISYYKDGNFFSATAEQFDGANRYDDFHTPLTVSGKMSSGFKIFEPFGYRYDYDTGKVYYDEALNKFHDKLFYIEY